MEIVDWIAPVCALVALAFAAALYLAVRARSAKEPVAAEHFVSEPAKEEECAACGGYDL